MKSVPLWNRDRGGVSCLDGEDLNMRKHTEKESWSCFTTVLRQILYQQILFW